MIRRERRGGGEERGACALGVYKAGWGVGWLRVCWANSCGGEERIGSQAVEKYGREKCCERGGEGQQKGRAAVWQMVSEWAKENVNQATKERISCCKEAGEAHGGG